MIDKKKRHILKHFHSVLYIVGFLLVLILLFPSIDIFIFNVFAGLKSEILTKVAEAITFLGSAGFIIALTVILIAYLAYKKRKNEIKFYLSSVFGGAILVYLLKLLIGRERPSGIFNHGLDYYSFPSGHAFISVVFYSAIALLLRYKNEKKADLIFLIPLFIGISRLFLGVHWLSDVLAGFFLGAIWLYCCAKIFLSKK